ncbi:MAG: S8 family serine peptidase [Verrucomicrobia bacterium]|nr:S8 family serine peptidase [Verrucomicrobiota bacterium]
MKNLLSVLSLFAALGGAPGSVADSPVPEQVLVKLKSNPSTRVSRSAVETVQQLLPGATYEGPLTADGWHQLTLPTGTTMTQALAELELSADVEYAEPNLRYALLQPARSSGGTMTEANRRVAPAAGEPTDPLFPRLYGLRNIGVPQAWQHSPGSNTVVIAVFDTGIDYTHPDLAANMWRNPGEIPGNRIDDDRNGFVDDVFGANVVNNTGDPIDRHGHGTHVAGTIGAVGHNGQGVIGVNQNVQLLAVRVARDYDGAFAGDLVRGLDYLTALKKRGVNLVAVNHSWGGIWPNRALIEAMGRLSAVGVVNAIAAGNSREDHSIVPKFPNEYNLPGIITSGAVDSEDHLSDFSDFGIHTVDVAAPGVFIWSTLPGNRYAAWSGTSMATPHLTGSVGLLYSVRPDLTPEQVKYLLMNTVDPLPEFDRGRVRSGGRINVGRAVQWLVEGKPLPTTFTRPEIPALTVTSVSRTPAGFDANEASSAPALSRDGRFVAFVSRASNLVPGDTNTLADVFLRDRQEGTVTRVSQTAEGRQADGSSTLPAISGDGQWVAFVTAARSLVPEDTTALKDIVLWQRESGALQWISRSEVGETSGNSDFPSLDFTGQRVVFQSNVRLVDGDTNGVLDVYLFDQPSGKLEVISRTQTGESAEGSSSGPVISSDGRWVAFLSSSSQLVEGDTNQVADAFVRDLSTGVTELVSRSSIGDLVDQAVTRVRISGDGRYVAFQTAARTLEPLPAGSGVQVYLRDRQEGRTWRVSKSAEVGALTGTTALEGISEDGRWVIFRSNSSQLPPGAGSVVQRVFGYDRLVDDVVALSYSDSGQPASAVPEFLGVSDIGISEAAISGNGGSIAQTTLGWNLAPGDGNAAPDIFVSDRASLSLDLSVRAVGESRETGRGVVGPAIVQYHAQSLRGQESGSVELRLINRGVSQPEPRVRIESAPPGVTWSWPAGTVAEGDGVFRLPPLAAGAGTTWTVQIPVPSAESQARVRLLAGTRREDGSFAVADGVTAAVTTDLKAPGAELISVGFSGAPLDRHALRSSISEDGERVVFHTLADHVIATDRNEHSDVFLRSRATRTNTAVSAQRGGTLGNDWSMGGQISADGRLVVFSSFANNLGADGNFICDVFVKNLETGTVELVSRRGTTFGDFNSAEAGDASISADGRWVCFSSHALNLVTGDTNRAGDVFRVDRTEAGAPPRIISRAPDGTLGNGVSFLPYPSSDGRWIVYSSHASNLSGSPDTNQTQDVYLWDAGTGANTLVTRAADGTAAAGNSEALSISDDGRWVTLLSDAPNLPGGLTDSAPHFYLWDRETGGVVAAEQLRSAEEKDFVPTSLLVRTDGDWLVLALRRRVSVGGGERLETRLNLLQRSTGRRVIVAQGARGTGVIPGGFSEVLISDSILIPYGQRANNRGRYLIFNGEGREGRAFVAQAYLYDRAEAEVRLAAGRGGSTPRTVDLEDANAAWRAVQVLVQPGVPAPFQLVLGNPGEFGETMNLTAGALGSMTLELRRADEAGEPPLSLPAKVPVQAGTQAWLKGTLTVPVGAELAAVELTLQSQLNATVWERVRLQPVLDSDGDGLADAWEQTHFRSLLLAGADTDSDGDGQSDREEFQAGSDPTKSTEPFRVSLEEVDGKARLRWPVVTDRFYTVQRSGGLEQTFEPSADGIRWLEGGLAEYVEVPEANTFYRVEVDLP